MCFSPLVEALKYVIIFQHKGTNCGRELPMYGYVEDPNKDNGARPRTFEPTVRGGILPCGRE